MHVQTITDLMDDGDTCEWAGRTVTLHIHSNDYTSIFDEQGEGAWCGRLEWVSAPRYDDYGHGGRCPSDWIRGRCEILDRDYGARLWWEVPADVEIGSDVHRNLRQTIHDVLEFGYCTIALECDGHVVILSGVEYSPDGYGWAISELMDDLEYDIARSVKPTIMMH